MTAHRWGEECAFIVTCEGAGPISDARQPSRRSLCRGARDSGLPKCAVLTPAGRGAIATVAVRGRGALAAAARRFRSASGGPLDDIEVGRVVFGRFRLSPTTT